VICPNCGKGALWLRRDCIEYCVHCGFFFLNNGYRRVLHTPPWVPCEREALYNVTHQDLPEE
jgi:hypothetical protein